MTNPDSPFGGLNMIFSGDFAQLPPPIGGENSSLYSWTVGVNTQTMQNNGKRIVALHNYSSYPVEKSKTNF